MTTLYPNLLYAQSDSGENSYLSQEYGFTYDGVEPVYRISVSSTYQAQRPMPGYAKSVLRISGVNDHFYNRILIEPNNADLGNIVSDQSFTIKVWNGFFDSVNLEGFSEGTAEGFSVTEPVTAPYVWGALEEQSYNVVVSDKGSATLDAQPSWIFDGVTYVAKFVGIRVTFWPIGPNWQNPLRERISWLTEIIESYDGTEQRRALRTRARIGYSYNLSARGVEAQLFENLIWGSQNRFYVLPVWTDVGQLTADSSTSSTTLSIDTTNRAYYPGGSVCVVVDNNTFEIFEIESVTPNSVVVTRAPKENWTSGVTVYPCVFAKLGNSVQYVMRTSAVVEAQVSFECDPRRTDPYLPDGSPSMTYNGGEVITYQPNWKDSRLFNSEFAFDFHDNSVGAMKIIATRDRPKVRHSYQWLRKNRSEISELRSLLGRLNGRQKSVYTPNWLQSFQVATDISSATLSIFVLNNQYDKLIQVGRSLLFIRTKSSGTFVRRVTNANITLSGLIELGIEEALNVDVAVGDVISIALVFESRLASDVVELVWHTATSLSTDTPFVQIGD